jgi:uncharacterized protein
VSKAERAYFSEKTMLRTEPISVGSGQIMKKYGYWLLFSGFLLSSLSSYTQNVFFARSNYSDSVRLEESIPALAKKAIENYREPDRFKYFDNLSKLQIVAGEFSNANVSLDSISILFAAKITDTLTAKAFLFQYKIYCRAIINSKNNSITPDRYRLTFKQAYDKLNGQGMRGVEFFFKNDLAADKKNLDNKIKTLTTKDSVSEMDAINLCRIYCIYKVYSATQFYAKSILADIDHEKYIEDDSVVIKMPDGAAISLTIVRNRRINTPQPVALKYNIYAGNDANDCKVAVQNGYTGIVANTRGKRLSPDTIEPYEHDGDDAYYIIDWISKQPWCNGKIGMYGGSYLGFAQWSAAKHLHPALKTMVPQVAVGAGLDFPMQGSIYMGYMLQWLHYVSDNKLTDLAGFSDNRKWDSVYGEWYSKGLRFRSLDTLEGRPNKVFQRWLNHPSYDSFWKNMTPQKKEFSKINIPILTTTGYWDDDQTGAMYYYKEYFKWNKSPDYYLLIGPYDHAGSQGYPKTELSGYTIDSVARLNINDLIFRWFDYVMKDSARPAILQDKVNFEVMGKNEWKHVSSLDKMHNNSIVLYLGDKVNDHRYPLLKSMPAARSFIDQQVDMTDRNDPRFKHGDIDAFPVLLDSGFHPEKEKLVFISDPVDNPFDISGAITANLNISINKKDIDLVLDCYEQTSDGKFFALNENIQRASYANDRENRQLLQPGKISGIHIHQTFITCKHFEKGSRIIITIGPNKNPGWEVNYGTGRDVSDESIQDAGPPLEIKWYNNSFIEIPVLQ